VVMADVMGGWIRRGGSDDSYWNSSNGRAISLHLFFFVDSLLFFKQKYEIHVQSSSCLLSYKNVFMYQVQLHHTRHRYHLRLRGTHSFENSFNCVVQQQRVPQKV